MMQTDKKDNRITCEVIQDLMPSYVDGLASVSTVEMIEEHVKECADCRAMLENMQADTQAEQRPDETDRKEIDFLRKSRKRGRRAVVTGILLTLLIAAAAIGAKLYVIGSEYGGDMAFDVDVDGKTMTVGVTAADSIHVIHGVDFTMEDGVVSGRARAVLPGLFHSKGAFTSTTGEGENVVVNTSICDWSGSFTFDEEIREIRIGDRVYWAGGRIISSKAADLFRTVHNYAGDAPANGRSLDALGITEDLGSLYSELETEKKPYIWRIILDEDQTKYRTEYLRKKLKGYGAALIGTVGNLNEVDFRYTADGKDVVVKVTEEDASSLLGENVKVCLTDAGALNDLLEKAGIE